MDGGTMKYGFGAIDALAGDINNRVASVESRLADLQSKINNLTTIWEGGSSDGFRMTKDQWNQAATDLNGVLKRIQIAVVQTNTDAQQTERSNTQRWG